MRNHVVALAALLALLVSAPSALASGKDVILDCTDDEVMSKTYTQKEYKDAIASFPADADQYGVCRDIIARAQESAATKGGSEKKGAPGTGAQDSGDAAVSSAPAQEQLAAADPADRAAAEAAAKDGSAPQLGTAKPEIDIAAVGAAPDTEKVSDLPTPILVLLALLLAGALAFAAFRIRSLVRARRA